jgi:hypothetical protein
VLSNDVSEYNLVCPFCGGKIRSVASREDQSPHRGDYLFCAACGGIGILTDRTMYRRGWCVRKPTRAESYRIAQHPGIRSIEVDWFGGH